MPSLRLNTGRVVLYLLPWRVAGTPLPPTRAPIIPWSWGVPKRMKSKGFDGKIEFFPIYDEKIDPVKISDFKSLTDFEDDEVKYFAGVAKYSVDFDVAPDFYSDKDSVVLSLGEFDAIAEASLNGQYLGNIWHPVIRVPVKLLHEDGNHMEVTPTMCRNRIIGDLRAYGQV